MTDRPNGPRPREEILRHSDRAEKAGDTLRAMLLALATAGIGAAYAVSTRLPHPLWLAGSMLFIFALGATLRSWFLVKERALRRKEAAGRGHDYPQTVKWSIRSSWTWDTCAAWLIITGAAVMAVGLARS